MSTLAWSESKQIRVRLTCIGLLCTRTDDDATAEDTSRMIVEHPAIFLVTRALLCGVVDGREVVDMSVVATDKEAA